MRPNQLGKYPSSSSSWLSPTASPRWLAAHLQSMVNRPTVDSTFNTRLNWATQPPPSPVTAGLRMANSSPLNSPATTSPHLPSVPIKGGDPRCHWPHLLLSFSPSLYSQAPPPLSFCTTASSPSSLGRHTASQAPVMTETSSHAPLSLLRPRW
jgi:hypothetical protein